MDTQDPPIVEQIAPTLTRHRSGTTYRTCEHCGHYKAAAPGIWLPPSGRHVCQQDGTPVIVVWRSLTWG